MILIAIVSTVPLELFPSLIKVILILLCFDIFLNLTPNFQPALAGRFWFTGAEINGLAEAIIANHFDCHRTSHPV